jgi:hypothetical protein
MNLLNLNLGDIVPIKDSPINKALKVTRKIDDTFIQLVDLQGVVVVTIEVINKEYKKEKKL